MKRKPVISSVLRSIGYSTATQTLEIEFIDQKIVYQYHGVARETYDQLLSASSHGKYYNSFIKDQYPFIKIESN